MGFTLSAALLDACVLASLESGDTYGYELTARIKATADVSESTLYPVLKRLQRERLLSTYDEAVNGRNRRYYSLTEDGRRRLKEYAADWERYKASVDSALYGGRAAVNNGLNTGTGGLL